MRPWFLLWIPMLALVLATGCPTDDDDDDTTEPELPVADLDMDSDRSGEIDATEDEEAAETEPPGAVIFVDVDDDNLDGACDFMSVDHAGDDENDLAPAVVTFDPPDAVADGDELQLTLFGDVEAFRLYIDQEPIMGMGGSGAVTEKTWPVSSGDPIDVEIEGVAWFATAVLELELIADGEQQSLDQVQLTTAPWLMQHHLDDAHEIWIMDGGFENGALINDFEDVIGSENVHLLPTGMYQWDVWVQDEVQYGYQIAPTGPMSVVFDTPRDGQGGGGGLTNFPVNELLGPDRGWVTAGEGMISSLDYGGNIECTPPISVDGTDYPYGRIYYGGKEGSGQPLQGVRDFFAHQTVQSPVMINSTWLAVGHVDEFISFIPDPDSDKGFKVLWADHDLAVELLEELDPNMSIPKYDDEGYLTVGEILDDAIIDYSEDIYLTDQLPVKDVMKAEFGLDEEDFIHIPGIWAQTNWGALAMITGMVNLVVFDEHLFIPDPWMRDELADEEDANGNYLLDPGEDLNEDGMLNTHNDPLQEYVLSVLPAGVEPHFVDTWQMYHLYWGEIHCGSEVRRTPTTSTEWWEVAIPELP